MDCLLTLLNVPKGTRLITRGSSTSYDIAIQYAMLAPNTGDPLRGPGGIVGTHEGYLHESTGLLGQNPVEHLKLGGTITDLSFTDGTSLVDGLGKPSTAGVPWMKIPVNSKADGSGAATTLYTHFVVPYGQYLFATAKAKATSGTDVGKILALHSAMGWLDTYSWFYASGTAAEWVTPTSGKWNMNFTISCWRLNSAGTLYGVGSGSYTTGLTLTFNPVYVDASYFESGVVEKARQIANSIATYGNSYSTLNPYYTQKAPSVAPELPQFGSFEDKFFPQDLNPDRWGDLASDCYGQIQCWDGNAAAYLRDSVLSVKAAKETVALAMSLVGSKNPVKFAKSLASLFLSFRYGWCLQAKDTISLLAIDYDRAYPHGLARRSSSRTYTRNGVPVTARMGVYFQPYSTKLTELEGYLRSIDLDFTLENLWDLVPLSFVIDWFTGLGDLFDRMDQMAQLDGFDVRLVGRSLKSTKSLIYQKATGRTDWQGVVSATVYRRHYQTEPIQPSLISYRNANQKFDHWLEGTALIVQRL